MGEYLIIPETTEFHWSGKQTAAQASVGLSGRRITFSKNTQIYLQALIMSRPFVFNTDV